MSIQLLGIDNINTSLSTHYTIYKIINLINNRYYIGQHITNNIYDDYMGSGKLILLAEAKYGLSSFTKEILFDYDNYVDMNNKEIELVQLSNCFPNDKLSYNLAVGGTGGNKIIWNDENRKIVSARFTQLYIGKGNPFYGKKHSIKTKQSISKNTQGENNGCYNRKWLYHPNTLDRVYVNKSEVQQYLNNGYVFGLGLRWYTNGMNNIRAHECPTGYKLGRIKTQNNI